MFQRGCRSGDACSMSSAFSLSRPPHVKAVSCWSKAQQIYHSLPSNRRRRLWLCNCIIKGFRCRWVVGSKVNLTWLQWSGPALIADFCSIANCCDEFISVTTELIATPTHVPAPTDTFLESLKVHKVGKYLRIKLWLRWKFFDMTFENISSFWACHPCVC